LETVITIRKTLFEKLTEQLNQDGGFYFCKFGCNKTGEGKLEILVGNDECSRAFKDDALKILFTKNESEFDQEFTRGTNAEPSNLAGKITFSPLGRWFGFYRDIRKETVSTFKQLKIVGKKVAKFESAEKIEKLRFETFQKDLLVGVVGAQTANQTAIDTLERLGRVNTIKIDGTPFGEASVFRTSSLRALSRCDYVVSSVGTDAERIALDIICAAYLKPRLDVFFSLDKKRCEIFATSPGDHCGFCLFAYNAASYPSARQGFLDPTKITRPTTSNRSLETSQFYKRSLERANVLWQEYFDNPNTESARICFSPSNIAELDVQSHSYQHSSFCPFCRLAGQGDSILSHIDKVVRNTAVCRG